MVVGVWGLRDVFLPARLTQSLQGREVKWFTECSKRTSSLLQEPAILNRKRVRAQELCESRGGRPGLPVPNSPCDLCGRKSTLDLNWPNRAQKLCESGGGRPGLPVPNSPCDLCGRKSTLDLNW